MTTIQVRTRFEGIHCYPGAPEAVAYLREPHRHMFGVCVEVEVFNEDRELEFVLVKHMIDNYIRNWPFSASYDCYNLRSESCESIAASIYNYMRYNVEYADKRYWKITVDEDGENGASVEYRSNKMTSVKQKRKTIKEDIKETEPRPLSLARYQDVAYRNVQSHESHKEAVMHWAIGLGEEAGETLSVIKHRYYAGCYKNDDDMLEDLVNELGDVLWHIAALCSVLDISMEDVAKYNIAKLINRYPNDKFEESRSQNRHELYLRWKLENDNNSIVHQIKKKREAKQNERL